MTLTVPVSTEGLNLTLDAGGGGFLVGIGLPPVLIQNRNSYMKSEVFNEDCLAAMRLMPDKAFDLAIVDPPYGIGEHGGKKREGGQARAKGLKSAAYSAKDWDNDIPTEEYFRELQRVSKNQIIWGGNYFIGHLQPTPCFIVWDKKSNDGSDFADCELAWTSFSTAVRKFKYDWIGFGYLNNPEGERKIHPTQKPVALYRWLLDKYAQSGDTILDSHLGSGSSRIAAHQMGFDFTGYELDPEYFAASEKRFELAIQQQSLFQ